MDKVDQYVRSIESRLVGRVFTHDHRLHLVLGIDRESDLVRLSCRFHQRTEIVHMPVAEVVLRLEEECRRHAATLERSADVGTPSL